jgi:hypothetical protein
MSQPEQSNIDLFFQDPTSPPAPSGPRSTLYMLRRDIRICLGINPDTGDKIDYQAIWPGAMATLAGIDLLGKFVAGGDSPRNSGKRFRRFITEYFETISPEDIETIYQLRNALMHSFGLFSQSKSGTVYRFVLTASEGTLVHKRPTDTYWVDVVTLFDKFEDAVVAYRGDLEKNQELQKQFSKFFPKYGKVHVFKPVGSAFEWLKHAQFGKASSLDDPGVSFRETQTAGGNSMTTESQPILKDEVGRFLLAEYELLKDSRASVTAQGENRARFFVAIVSATVAVMALLPDELLNATDVFYFATSVVVSLLLVFGWLTFARLVEAHISNTKYTRGLNRIRRYFLEADSRIADYLMLPINDDFPVFGKVGSLSTKVIKSGLSTMIAVINSILAGVLLCLIAFWIFRASVLLCLIIGLLASPVAFVFHYWHYDRQMKKARESISVKFPSGSSNK